MAKLPKYRRDREGYKKNAEELRERVEEAIELILHRYMSGAIEAEADGDAEACGGSSEGSSHNRLQGL